MADPGRSSTSARADGPFLFTRKASTIIRTSSALLAPWRRDTANSAPLLGSRRVCPTTARRRLPNSISTFRAVVEKNCFVFSPPSARKPSKAALEETASGPRKAFSRGSRASSNFHIPAKAAASAKTAPFPLSRNRFSLLRRPVGRCLRKRTASRRPRRALIWRDFDAPSASATEKRTSRWFPSPTFAIQLITSSSWASVSNSPSASDLRTCEIPTGCLRARPAKKSCHVC